MKGGDRIGLRIGDALLNESAEFSRTESQLSEREAKGCPVYQQKPSVMQPWRIYYNFELIRKFVVY